MGREMYMKDVGANSCLTRETFAYMPLAREEGSVEMTDDEKGSDADLAGKALRPPRRRARGFAAACLGACGTFVGVALLAIGVMPRLNGPQAASMENSMSKALGAFGVAKTLVDGITGIDRIVSVAKRAYPLAVAVGGPTAALRNQTMESEQGILSDSDVEKLANLTGREVLPVNNKNNGNLCPDDEEMYSGLCYRKCSKFSELNGMYPIRTSAFSCCQRTPCTFFNSRFSNILNFCDGFDIAGSHAQGGCPHLPGDCYENEEFNMGVCYKKCAILTVNEFPFRAAADTCCRYNSHLACLDALNTYTNMTLNVGGGDGQGEAFWEESHLPDMMLTEEKSHWTQK